MVVEDDGKGVDTQAVLASAKKKGLSTDQQLSDAAILSLLFASGFSTRDEVTMTSGRGVGLDSVQTEVKNLGGTGVHVATELGSWTRFSFEVPLARLLE